MPTTTRVYKLLVLLFILCVIFVGGDYFIRFHVILPEFAELERQEAKKDITRCTSSIEREFQHVEKLATDWALWDDLYQYVIDGNEPFVTSNFQWDTLQKTGIDLMYVINTEGNIVYSGISQPETAEMIKLQQLPAENFPSDHYLLNVPDNANSFAGIFLTENGPLLLASHKILTSAGRGPSRGILLVGRFLDDQVMQVLRQQTQIEFTVGNPLTAPFSEIERRRVEDLAAGKQVTEIVDEHTLLTFGLLTDLQKHPALLITPNPPPYHGSRTQYGSVFFTRRSRGRRADRLRWNHPHLGVDPEIPAASGRD